MTPADWRNPDIFEQGDNEPVICVSWKDASAYAKWLADTSGQPYRLPSEAEWEYAARGGLTGANYWTTPEGACEYANIADQTAKRRHAKWSITDCNDGFYGLAPVGSLKPNAFGLYDMLGNAKQWVAGCATESIDDIPADGSPAESGGSCSRPTRGTAWDSTPQLVRFAFREGAPKTGYAASNIGFRVALGQ
jgi:formylglycine-generating enzyme required for sulfatase activity